MKRADRPIRLVPEDGIAIIPLTHGKEAIIDIAFAKHAGEFTWRFLRFYAVGQFRINGVFRRWLLHRLIVGAHPGQFVDHINGNQLDNRECNLRIVTVQQNTWNRHKLSTKNTTGYTGVRFDKKWDAWKANIGLNGKKIHLGTFRTVEEAAAARRAAELKYYGEFAPQRKEQV